MTPPRIDPTTPLYQDPEASQISRGLFHGLPVLSKQCYLNAQRLLQELYLQGEADGIWYAEGYAIDSDYPFFFFEHGYLIKDSVVIDPTLAGKPVRYYTGLVADGATMSARWQSQKGIGQPLFFDYGFGGLRHPGMKAAQDVVRDIIACHTAKPNKGGNADQEYTAP